MIISLSILFIFLIFFFQYILLVALNLNPFFIFEIIALLAILLQIVYKASKTKSTKLFNITLLIPIVLFLMLISYNILNTPLFKARKLANIIKEPITMDFNKGMHPFDISKAPLVTEDMAKQLMDKHIGTLGNYGSFTKIGNLTLQNIKGQLYFVAPLEYTGFFSWLNNRGYVPYIILNATTKEINVIKDKVRYGQGSYFNEDVSRMFFLKYPNKNLIDITFEVDDTLTPYWTASVFEYRVGFRGREVVGVITMNAQTGETEYYSKENAPNWIDRIVNKDIAIQNLDYRGKYKNGFRLFNHKGKIKTTEGSAILYNNNNCYFYTGVTSVGKDSSLLGFYLTNTRTGETTFFSVSGAIENSAIQSAEGKVQHLGYNGSFPLLLRIENNPTYLVPLSDKNGLIKMFAFVNVQDYTLIGIGDDINTAKNEYIKMLINKNQLSNTAGEKVKITAKVVRINQFIQNNNSYYAIMIDGYKNIFIVSLNQSQAAALTKEGDTIELEFIKSDAKNINVLSFKNLTLE